MISRHRLLQSLTPLCLVCFIAAAGCGPKTPLVDGREDTCALFDSLYMTSGFETGAVLVGKATIDAEQHRLRGKVNLDVQPSGDVMLDFASTILFGSHREDFFFSLIGDTIRVIDRERGHYFESQEAERFLGETLGLAFGVSEAIGLALGRPPVCREIADLRVSLDSGGYRFEGRVAGSDFSVVFAHGRLREIRWPIHPPQEAPDKLLVSYDWATREDGSHALRQVVMRLEDREWRCKITSASI